MATAADVGTWIREHPDGNIALRLPPGVVGIDADPHKGPAERESWLELLDRCGPLPNALRCTSRQDDQSGVRLFRVADGLTFAGDLPAGSNGVSPGEIIQHHHRYVVAWPSIHPDTGRMYRWSPPAGDIPVVSELPWLPDAWIEVLTAPAQHKPAAREKRAASESTYRSDVDWPSVYRQMPSDRLKEKLTGWLTELQTTGENYRTPELFATASRLGSVVVAGRITVQWAFDVLYDACEACGYFTKYDVSEWSRHVSNALRRAGAQW